MPLTRISRLLVQFAPLKPESRSAKEFLARVTTAKAKASNPECKVETKVRISGSPFVLVEFANKQQDKIQTAGLTAPQILAQIQEKTQVVEAQDILQKVGLAINSGKGSGIGKLDFGAGQHTHKTGESRKVAIT